MEAMTVRELIDSTGGTLLSGSEEGIFSAVSTNSKDADSNSVFFAFIGENFDAHDFLPEVLSNGCSIIVVSNKDKVPETYNGTAVLVSDTTRAYQCLAKYYKQAMNPVTIGITGSIGKTTLKNMIANVCNQKFRTVQSYKNENNDYGVPKTIFRIDKKTEVLILEMGMRAPGEIDRLADIGRPDIAVISNIGISHRENFDSDDGIFNAKMEITNYLKKDNTLVINGDDPQLAKVKNKGDYKVVTVGTGTDCDYIVTDVKYEGGTGVTFMIEKGLDVERFRLPVVGLYNGISSGLASAVLAELNVSMAQVADSLKTLPPVEGRLELKKTSPYKVIDDTYNASPDSVKSGLDYLMIPQGIRRIAVLGDMKELGDDSEKLHTAIGEQVRDLGIDILVTVGQNALDIATGASSETNERECAQDIEIFSFDNAIEAKVFLNEIVNNGDVILVKGSRAMRMEEIVETLINGDAE